MSKPSRSTPRPKPKARLSLRWPAGWRPRLLPVTIFAAVLMLGVRIGDLWVALGGNSLTEILEVKAQPASKAGPAVPASPPPVRFPATPTAAAATPAETPVAGNNGPSRPAGSGEGGSEAFGAVQLELLQRFSERREELDRRARELDQREALLVAAEKRIDQKVAELTELRTNIEGLLRQTNEKQQAQMESLVKIYESMKPKEAARIFEALEMPILLDVMERMREAKSAPILAAMDPMKAKEVTASLAERRAIPAPPR
jgi:flagellar motility protein MotE (MotC chaperone)